MTKVCTKCGIEQPVGNFSKCSKSPDCLQYVCKDCVGAYIAAHKEQKREYDKQHHAEHREEYNERSKRWDTENRERKSERGKQHYAKNSDAILRKHTVWRANNKETMQNSTALWRKNNPDVCRAYHRSYVSRKAGLASTLTAEQWKHILSAFNNTCAYCGSGDKTLHQEHFVPLNSGGEYTHDNIIPACKSCNSSKNTKSFWEWYPTSNCYDKQREKNVMRFLHYTGESQQLTLCP